MIPGKKEKRILDRYYINIRNNNKLKEKFGQKLNRVLRQAEVCRETVFWVHKKVLKDVPADRALSGFLRKRKEFGSRDRKLLYDLTFSVFRWLGWTHFSEKKANVERDFLASLILDGKTDHDVVILWAIEHNLPEDWRGKISSSSLKNRCDMLVNWLGFSSDKLKQENLFPQWFWSELSIPQSKDFSIFKSQLIQVLQSRSPVWIRFEDRFSIEKNFRKLGFKFYPHPTLYGAGHLSKHTNLRLLEDFRKGRMEVQDISSQAVALVCNPNPEENWWDVCAGAGGKTLNLAQLMKGKGKIFATDKRKSALKEAQVRCLRWGYSNISFRCLTDVKEKNIQKKFDGILIDAPCSGTGTWRRSPDSRWRTNVLDIERLTKVQKLLLSHYSKFVKPRGILIYSVCSILKKETIDIVDFFLKKHLDFELSPCINPISNVKTDGIIWIWPQDHNSDGMFISKLCRK